MNIGYIVKKDGVWVVAEYPYSHKYGYGEINPIHPDHISTVIDNGCVKPEYSGEVEYELEYGKKWNTTTYAIPKPIEGKADVWEEALELIRNKLCPTGERERLCENVITLLKHNYNPLTKKNAETNEEPPTKNN